MEENKNVTTSPEVEVTPKEEITPKGVVTDTQITAFEKVMNLLGKYGPLKMIYSLVMFVIFSFMVYIAANPGIIFEKYNQYITQKHNASVDYRMESAPLIRTYLNQLAAETGAERAYILEFHNGKSNPSGLQWQFGDLTFINDGTDDISDEIQNVSLSRYNFVNIIHDTGYWAGTVEELLPLDERFYNRMRLNNGTYFGFQMIYGSNMTEIGVLGVTYIGEEHADRQMVLRAIHKYASSISPLLDEMYVDKKN